MLIDPKLVEMATAEQLADLREIQIQLEEGDATLTAQADVTPSRG